MTQYFVKPTGEYIGAFDGALPPDGAVEVMTAPETAAHIWDGGQWVAPPEPTLAEKVAGLSMRSSRFWIALQLELVARAQLTLQDDVQAFVLVAIESAEQAAAIPAETAMAARILVRTATEFLRQDPDNPGLLDGIGALLGLSAADIDAIFASAAGLA